MPYSYNANDIHPCGSESYMACFLEVSMLQ